MSFYAKSFIYNGIPSDTFGLFISDLDASAINSSMGSFDVTLYEQKIYRKQTPYFFGATGVPHLEFDMSCFSEQELTAEDFEGVQRWLFGSTSYKTLQIVQEDMQEVVFYAILNSPEIIRVGNIIMGCKFHVVCNSPYGFKYPQTVVYTYTASIVDANEIFYNASDDISNYLYPTTVITMNNIGGDITITNSDDVNRVFEFTDLQPNEVITIDNSLQTISSSTGLKRLSLFNKHFLRFVPNVNHLHIQGNVLSISNTFSLIVKKIGG